MCVCGWIVVARTQRAKHKLRRQRGQQRHCFLVVCLNGLPHPRQHMRLRCANVAVQQRSHSHVADVSLQCFSVRLSRRRELLVPQQQIPPSLFPPRHALPHPPPTAKTSPTCPACKYDSCLRISLLVPLPTAHESIRRRELGKGEQLQRVSKLRGSQQRLQPHPPQQCPAHTLPTPLCRPFRHGRKTRPSPWASLRLRAPAPCGALV